MTRNVSYFSMEIGIKPDIKTYSGGLGVLAGDTLKAAADHGLNFTAVTLMYGKGYFKQIVKDGKQTEQPQNWDYFEKLEDTGVKTNVEIEGREVSIKAWRYTYEGENGEVDIYFLDTSLDENSEEDKKLTERLYMGGQKERLAQEIILGIGGARMLRQLGIDTDYYHMNEGHSALLTTEAKEEKVFTTHTPVPAGHDKFSRELVERMMPEESMRRLQFEDELNMTELALEHSNYCNGVSDRHAQVSHEMFPGYEIDAVTNGVHSATWSAKPFSDLFDENIHSWRTDPARLTKVAGIEDSKIWKAKQECKLKLSQHLEKDNLEQDVFTIGFARRSTDYKRPTLIFRDLDKLETLAEDFNGLQIVFGGKAHPEDTRGKELVSKVLKFSDMLENVDVYFIEDYSMGDSLEMVSGVDLWLNNPRRGQEASGTSGMKAAHNGTPQLSTPDGWWLEGCIEGITGWDIGENYVEGEDEDRIDSESIYEKLEEIMSIYENERQEWIKIMKNCITLNASHFNTDRMLKEYLAKAYN